MWYGFLLATKSAVTFANAVASAKATVSALCKSARLTTEFGASAGNPPMATSTGSGDSSTEAQKRSMAGRGDVHCRDANAAAKAAATSKDDTITASGHRRGRGTGGSTASFWGVRNSGR